MPKKLTCMEIIAECYSEVPGHPPIINLRGTKMMACFVMRKNGRWDAFTFNPHGTTFVKVATGLQTGVVVKLLEWLERL